MSAAAEAENTIAFNVAAYRTVRWAYFTNSRSVRGDMGSRFNKKGRLDSRPFAECYRVNDYQLNLTIIWMMRWPIVFVAVPKFGLESFPVLSNPRFKFWSPLMNVRFGKLRKL